MKSFTQRWREASEEAEDQPMEDTPTDPKEAPVPVPCSTSSIWPLTDTVYMANVQWNLTVDPELSPIDHMLHRPKSMREHAMELEERADRLRKERDDLAFAVNHNEELARRLQARNAELEKGIKSVYEYVNDGPDPISLWTVALKLEAILTPAPPEEKRP